MEKGINVCSVPSHNYQNQLTLLQELLGMIDGYGKTNARRNFHAIYANRFAIQIDQWSARVAKRNGRICLDVTNGSA